jgi:integrase
MSVYRRGNRWYYYVKIRGVRRRGAIPEARTKYQALEAERCIRDEIFEGRYHTGYSTKTLKEFYNECYLPWAKVNKRSWRNDVSRAKPLLASFGARPLSAIDPFSVEKYKIARSKTVTRRGQPRSRTTVNRELQLLSRIFTLAKSSRLVSQNPMSEVRLFKGEARRTRYLLPDEERRLFAVLTGRRAHLRLLVTMALQTGMRLGEMLQLRTRDLDLHRGEIRVTHTKTDEDRTVPISDALRSELAAHLEGREFVFSNPATGSAYQCIKRAFESARRLAKIEDLRFHDLRHTAATRMAEAGTDPFTIAAILGHKRIEMTARYAHSTQQTKRIAIAALERASKETGPQMGHKQEQRPVLTAAK